MAVSPRLGETHFIRKLQQQLAQPPVEFKFTQQAEELADPVTLGLPSFAPLYRRRHVVVDAPVRRQQPLTEQQALDVLSISDDPGQ